MASKVPIDEGPKHNRPLESNSGSPSSSDAAGFARTEFPNHEEYGPPIDNLSEQGVFKAPSFPWHAEHGPPIDIVHVRQAYEEDFKHHNKLWWSRVRHVIRDPAAEFLGCFTLIIFGDGSVAQVLLRSNPNLPEGSQSKGAYQSISWGKFTSHHLTLFPFRHLI
jgi:hypothetical protein